MIKSLGNARYSVTGKGTVTVADIAGHVMMTADMAKSSIVDLSSYPKGIYLIAAGGKCVKVVR